MKTATIPVMITILVLPFMSSLSFAETLLVPDDYPTIQAAIDAARDDDVVMVAAGIYFENIDFHGMPITVKSRSGAEETTIDGGQKGSVVTFSEPTKLYAGVAEPVLQGFTLTNGTGTWMGEYSYGGGIFCSFGSPTITENIITGNSVTGTGGGIQSGSACAPVIAHNTICANTAISEYSGRGGGISCGSTTLVTKNLIYENLAKRGGGINCWEEETISDNQIFRNEAFVGGGIYCHDGSATLIQGNHVIDNEAEIGGGIHCQMSTATLFCNLVKGNSAQYGAGIYAGDGGSVKICDTRVVDNSAGLYGGGIFCEYSSSNIIENCVVASNTAVFGAGFYCNTTQFSLINTTVVKNRAFKGGGAISLVYQESGQIKNSILWDNCPDEVDGISSVKYCNVEGGYPGHANINADPHFVSPDHGDYHLGGDSPCKDAGHNDYVNPEGKDYEGDPRISGGQVDMGADEFHPHLYCTGHAVPGCKIETVLIGSHEQTAVLLVGSEALEEPRPSKYGDWYLKFPIMALPLGTFPSEGYIKIPARIPKTLPAPVSIPMQGAVEDKLTNLFVIHVK